MSTFIIVLLASLSIILGLFFWKSIQVSREGDSDFERRDEIKEELSDDESIL